MRTRLERLLAIEKEIRSGRYPSVEDLCRTYSVKTRTVYADIQILRERLGLEIEFDRARNGYFNAVPGSTLPSFDLSSEEYLLLVCGCETLSASLGSAIRPVLDRVLEKIRERLPSDRSIERSLMNKQIQCSTNEIIEVNPIVFLGLLRACFERKTIELSCLSASGTVVIEPTGLLEANKVWRLSGVVRGTEAEEHFLLTDIIDYRLVNPAEGESLNRA